MSYTGVDGRDTHFRLMDQLRPHWRRLAVALKFHYYDIAVMKQKDDPVIYLLSEWLQGANQERDSRPVTWATLITALRDANVQEEADMLEKHLVLSQVESELMREREREGEREEWRKGGREGGREGGKELKGGRSCVGGRIGGRRKGGREGGREGKGKGMKADGKKENERERVCVSVVETVIQHEVKPSALFVLRPHSECYNFHSICLHGAFLLIHSMLYSQVNFAKKLSVHEHAHKFIHGEWW